MILKTLRRFFIVAILTAILAATISFAITAAVFLCQSTSAPKLWFVTIFTVLTAITLSAWTLLEYQGLRRGSAVARKLKVSLGDVMWLADKLNQFAILETWTREEFLRELEEEKNHRPHHPDCDEVTGSPRRRSRNRNPFCP